MELEKQVVSLELAKKLKKLGVEQDSYFVWATFRNESSPKEQWKNIHSVLIKEDDQEDYIERRYLKNLKIISAFTVAELGEMLPDNLNNYYTSKYLGDWRYSIEDDDGNMTAIGGSSTTESNARAKIIIYLIENKLIKEV